MNYYETINYIHTVSWTGSRPGLSRITELCRLLGDPQNNLRFIHVAGTNGKGSTCAMLDSILRNSGYRVGLFTSPYVLEFEERIIFDGKPISKEDLSRVVTAVRPFADSMEDRPTEFELITAAALYYYAEQNADIVILEAGMGGRYDSTNVIPSSIVSVITGIALDHTAILGDTVEKIAWEKAGIVKAGCPVVIGDCSQGAADVIIKEAKGQASPVTAVDYDGVDAVRSDINGTDFTWKGRKYSLSLLGKYQTRNAALVLTVTEILRSLGYSVPEESVRSGLPDTKWKARFELMAKTPLFIYDGGHNPQGVEAACENIRLLLNGKAVLLMGMMADKDHKKAVELLSAVADSVHTVRPSNPRAMSAEELASEFEENNVSAAPHASVEEGVAAAVDAALTKGLPVVALGSLYMYGDVYKAVGRLKNSGTIK